MVPHRNEGAEFTRSRHAGRIGEFARPATLLETGGVVGGSNGAAARLGLPRTTLISKMRRLGINPFQRSTAPARTLVYYEGRSMQSGAEPQRRHCIAPGCRCSCRRRCCPGDDRNRRPSSPRTRERLPAPACLREAVPVKVSLPPWV
jgi:hypothetical protein